MIAHAEFLDDNSVFTQNPELVRKIAESRIWVNPTLYTSVSNHEGILFVANGRKLTPEEQKKDEPSKPEEPKKDEPPKPEEPKKDEPEPELPKADA